MKNEYSNVKKQALLGAVSGGIAALLVMGILLGTGVIGGYGDEEENFSGLYAPSESTAAQRAEVVSEKIKSLPTLSANEVEAIERRIRALQERVGYTSDYKSWIAKVTPPDLE